MSNDECDQGMDVISGAIRDLCAVDSIMRLVRVDDADGGADA